MSKQNVLEANIYTKRVMEAATDIGLARKTVVLVADETGKLVKQETVLPGPRCRVRLVSTREFKVLHHHDKVLSGEICVQGSQNNRALSDKWLGLTPVWRKQGDYEVLGAILDERGSKINFELLDDSFETPGAAGPAE